MWTVNLCELLFGTIIDLHDCSQAVATLPSSLKFIRLLRVVFSSQRVITTRSNRMKFRLPCLGACNSTFVNSNSEGNWKIVLVGEGSSSQGRLKSHFAMFISVCLLIFFSTIEKSFCYVYYCLFTDFFSASVYSTVHIKLILSETVTEMIRYDS